PAAVVSHAHGASAGAVEACVLRDRQKGPDEIRHFITEYAANRGATPQALDQEAGRALTQTLRDEGYMSVRKFVPTVSETLGVSRATVYHYLKSPDTASAASGPVP
ncbi:helix-turn-helix domain-containing protein, partial [Kocuria sabuli]|uniref:helix-turn-helix domain-containing protein n=1 Tax=Kocuria sabuli TaxID=3071448 RepID=UPI0034D3E40A